MEKKFFLEREKIEYIIIHHTATSRDRTTFRAVKDYHIKKRGFLDIGYHFFIDGKGFIYPGRSIAFIGAHCKTPPPSMNFRSLGICLAGNFEKEKPLRKQLEFLDYWLKFLMDLCRIPFENVLGHRQVKGTATLCPGRNLLRWLDEWRGI